MKDYINGKIFNNLTAADCIDQYAVSFLTTRGGVFLVHEFREDLNSTWGNDNLLGMTSAIFSGAEGGPAYETWNWICRGGNHIDGFCQPFLDGIRENASNWSPFDTIEASVIYCLSRPIENQLCRVNFNIHLATAVIISNLIKMVILGYISLYLAPDRLLVLGDAIQSFLTSPDLYSRQSCLASMRLVQESFRPRRTGWSGARSLFPIRKRWITPVGRRRVGVGAFL